MDPKTKNLLKCSPWTQYCFIEPTDSTLLFTTHLGTTLKSSLQREIRKDGIHFKTEISENQHNTATKHSISNAVISQAQVKIQEWPNNHQISGLIKRNSLLHNTLHTGITKPSTATLEEIKHIKDVNTCEAWKTSNIN